MEFWEEIVACRDMIKHMVTRAHQDGSFGEFWLEDDPRFVEIIKDLLPGIYEKEFGDESTMS